MEEVFDAKSEFSGKTPEELRQMAIEAKERAKAAREAAALQRSKIADRGNVPVEDIKIESEMSQRMAAVREKLRKMGENNE